MGKISILTKEQKLILDGLSQNEYIRSRFYFTGDTALALHYLEHRYSDDIDLFTESKFDSGIVFSLIEELSKKHHFKHRSETLNRYICFLYNLPGNLP